MQHANKYNIKEIINTGSIITHFQPIISLKDKKIVGVEALSRGISADNTNLISPLDLISCAADQQLSLELDRLFRSKALDSYRKIDPAAEVLLFLNVDTKILDNDELKLGWTSKKAESMGLKSQQIAIEICESNIEDTEKLINFVDDYRSHGFIIAIDDFGNSHSNLERIIQIKPDIIKISRALIDGVNTDFYKEAIVRSIVHLSKNIGAVTIAEGVEEDRDVLKCYELGINLYQGFYFAKPSDCCINSYQECRKTIHKTLFKLSGHMKQHNQEKQYQHTDFLKTCKTLLDKFKTATTETFPAVLGKIDISHSNIDCLYLLDTDGHQTYKINLSGPTKPYHQHHLFQKVGTNSDHSIKDYFVLSFDNDSNISISDEFMSYTSKNYCKTISTKFLNKEGSQYTLCIDFILHKNETDERVKAVASR